MVVGGAPNLVHNKSEIYDLSGQNLTCPPITDCLLEYGSAGIFINNKSMVCGGYSLSDYTSKCYSYNIQVNINKLIYKYLIYININMHKTKSKTISWPAICLPYICPRHQPPRNGSIGYQFCPQDFIFPTPEISTQDPIVFTLIVKSVVSQPK